MLRAKRLKVVGALLTAAFSVYVLLDSFVIERRAAIVTDDASAHFACQTAEPVLEEVCLVPTAAGVGNDAPEETDEETALSLPAGTQTIGSYRRGDSTLPARGDTDDRKL